MAAVALLRETDNSPTDDDIDQTTNLCRCGSYGRIRKTIKRVAETSRG